jgi:hypothetical protein
MLLLVPVVVAASPRLAMDEKLITPKILYQTWKTKSIPANFVSNQKKWFDVINYIDPGLENDEVVPTPRDSKFPRDPKPPGTPSPGWRYILLDDDDLRELVATHFPKHLKAYDGFSKNIERVDFARLVMMYLGGVYADLDTYPVKSIDQWVNQGKIILGCEPIEHAKEMYDGREKVLCNAFMISPPSQTLWAKMMDYVVKNYEKNYKPVYNTGPMSMTLFMESRPDLFTADAGVVITDPCVFFPQMGNGKFSPRCIDSTGALKPQTYVVHEWLNSWTVPWYRDPEWLNRRYWFWGLMTVFTILWLRAYNH